MQRVENTTSHYQELSKNTGTIYDPSISRIAFIASQLLKKDNLPVIKDEKQKKYIVGDTGLEFAILSLGGYSCGDEHSTPSFTYAVEPDVYNRFKTSIDNYNKEKNQWDRTTQIIVLHPKWSHYLPEHEGMFDPVYVFNQYLLPLPEVRTYLEKLSWGRDMIINWIETQINRNANRVNFSPEYQVDRTRFYLTSKSIRDYKPHLLQARDYLRAFFNYPSKVIEGLSKNVYQFKELTQNLKRPPVEDSPPAKRPCDRDQEQ